jgi:hypothetical protein
VKRGFLLSLLHCDEDEKSAVIAPVCSGIGGGGGGGGLVFLSCRKLKRVIRSALLLPAILTHFRWDEEKVSSALL